MPTPVLNGESPYSKLFTQSPNYLKLRVFGCLCFPWLRPYATNKLDDRSAPCVFLGYSLTQSAYLCLDKQSGRIYTSRYVQFVETAYPFAKENTVKQSTSPSTEPATHMDSRPSQNSVTSLPLIQAPPSSPPSSDLHSTPPPPPPVAPLRVYTRQNKNATSTARASQAPSTTPLATAPPSSTRPIVPISLPENSAPIESQNLLLQVEHDASPFPVRQNQAQKSQKSKSINQSPNRPNFT